MSKTKVKVCGVTQATQVAELVDLAVDAIGVILFADSPRLVTEEQAIAIREKIPAFITMVGVFVDCDLTQVDEYSKRIGLDLVQLHGAETPDYAQALNVPHIKAIRAKTAEQVYQEIVDHSAARAILLDPYVAGKHGGTGQQLDSSVWPTGLAGELDSPKLILAGGLSPENLISSVQKYQPFGVDLNSGVEKAPGIKDIKLVADCLQQLGR
ncbi:MAG: phosphoribosylanthranilate isomerase [Acidiferrobacterales bacterium]|nr:phosphoribosylanthranilate isomerase [Acidiferrobacterales bacterium]